MIRTVLLAAMLGTVAAPALAQGGVADEAHKAWAEKQRKYKEKGQTPPTLFNFLFGDDKKKPKAKTASK